MTTVWRFYLCQIGDQSFETIWQNVNACKYLRRLMVDYKSYSNCNSLPKLLLPAATFSFIQGCGSRYRKILDSNPYSKIRKNQAPDIKMSDPSSYLEKVRI